MFGVALMAMWGTAGAVALGRTAAKSPAMRELAAAEETDETEGEGGGKTVDFMSSFCSFAESMKNMSAFDKMRANGKDVVPVTLADLAAEAAAQAERRRLKRERVS